jgi:hypothetical protein
VAASAPPRLGDLVEVPELRTVVQLADLHDPTLRRALLDSFLLTPDAEACLQSMVRAIGGGRGQGFFVTGHFGTGKSHLLSMLALLCEDPGAWAPFAEGPLAPHREAVAAARPLVVSVSLLEHAAEERLEDIVAAAVGAALGGATRPDARALGDIQALLETRYPEELRRFLLDRELRADDLFRPEHADEVAALCARLGVPLRPHAPRGETAHALLARVTGAGHGALVLLLDELSEFLRGKPGRAFIDDIRYLQLLGEVGARAPLHVVGALQESLDAAGELAPETFNKIKDRYVRMTIGAEHLEALVAQRLLRRKPGADAEIARLSRGWHTLFPGLAYPADRLDRLFPIHPATLDVLEDLRELFSRRRGVVDFVQAQLRGDPARGITGRMDAAATGLLGPDAVFDHFKARLLEEPRARPYHDVVYRHFEREGPALFPDETQRTLALRALKVLVLAALSPRPGPVTVRRLAEMLLHKASALDPQANYLLVRDLCDRLARQGAYVTRVPATDPLDDAFGVDYRVDAGLLLRGQVAEAERSIAADDPRLFTRLALLCAEAAVPLASLVVQTESFVEVVWQGTRRQVRVLLRAFDELRGDELEKIVADVTAGDADAALVLGRALEVERQQAYLDREVAPRLRELWASRAAAIAFWLPRPPAEPELLRRALALSLLGDALRDDESQSGRALREHAAERLRDVAPKVSARFTEAYLEGTVRWGGATESAGEGPAPRSPRAFGPLGFDQIVSAVAQVGLDAAHPLHANVRPGLDPVPEQVQVLLEAVLRPGSLDLAVPGSRHAAALVEQVLAPLRLVRRDRERKLVHLDADPGHSEIVAEYLIRARELAAQQPSGRARLPDLQRALRKGRYGLGRGCFEVVTLALLCTGQLSGYTAGRRRGPEELSAHGLRQLTEVGFGEILDAEEQELLRKNSLLPPAVRGGTLTLPRQEEAWQKALERRTVTLTSVEQVRAHLARVQGFRSLDHLDLAGVERDLTLCAELAGEIEPGAASRPGLTRFSRAVARAPHAVDAFRRLKPYRDFFGGGGLDGLVRAHEYLFDPALAIPPDPEHAPVRELLEAARAAARDPAALRDAEHPARLRAAFDAFQTAYAAAYRAEHEAAMADPRFAALDRLHHGEPYRALARLAGLPGLVVADDRARVDRMLRAARAARCDALRAEALLQRPRCACAFALGGSVSLPDPAAVEAAIGRGLLAHLAELRRGAVRERLVAHATALEQIHEAAAARTLRDFLDRPAPQDPADALAAARDIDDALLARLHEALHRELVVVERDLDALVEELEGRTLPAAAARALFDAWLASAAAPPEGAFVRVVSARRGGGDGPIEELAALARDHFPDLGPVLRRGPRELALLALCGRVAAAHRIEAGAVFAAAGAADAAPHAPALGALLDHVAADPAAFAALLAAADEEIVARGAPRLAGAVCRSEEPADLADACDREDASPAVLRALASRFLRAVDAAAAAGRSIEPPELPARAGLPPALGALRAELAEALPAAARLAAVAPAAGAGARGTPVELPASAAGWTRLFLDRLCRLGLDEARLARVAARHALEDPAAAAARGERLRAVRFALGRGFAAFYEERYSGWLADGRGGPAFLDRALPALRERLRGEIRPGVERVVVVDALRWDAWLHVRQHVLPTLGPPLRVLDEVPVWSRLPTTTAANAHWLTRGGAPPGPPRLTVDETTPTDTAAAPAFEVEGQRAALVTGLDERLHHSRHDLLTLYDEAAPALAAALRPLVEGSPPGSLIVLAADHGFVESPSFRERDPHAEPRYRHGGATPWEVIVPLVALLRA